MDRNELIQLAKECGAFGHQYYTDVLCVYPEYLEKFTRRIRAAVISEALLEVEQEKTAQVEHYGMCSALAQGGSKMHRAECNSTEGVILGCEYIAERLKKMAEGNP